MQSVAPAGAPRLILVDSVRIVESESLYVGKVVGFAAAVDGSYYITNARTRTVNKFGADGRPLRVFGKPGDFPEGVRVIGEVGLGGDSLMAVVLGGRGVQVFDARSGRPLWNARFPIGPVLSIGVGLGGIVFSSVDSAHRTTLGLIRGASDSVTHGGPFPNPLGISGIVDAYLVHPKFALIGADSVAVALQTANAVFVGAFGGRTFDSIPVPAVRRRGNRPDLVQRFIKHPPTSIVTEFDALSVPWALARMSSGLFAYVTTDQSQSHNRRYGTLYISLADPATHRTCSDAPIDVPRDPHPWTAFHGDTLLVLSQYLSASMENTSIIRKYLVQSGDCAVAH
jgi:hypothetical protein